MNEKASPDQPSPTRTEAGEATVDLPEGLGFFHVGQVLGERYEILELLGRGGMGEVWRAFDLKLRVEVALKALRDDLFQSERRLEMLRQEVRAAREVVSPNVCRIFDLHEIDGRELVSMEYVDGATLLGVLQERGPLELKEAQDIASQFLSGLEAIHRASLVHRDVKPENIMLTRAGRVVVMDFGLARGPESGAGSVSGTPAYMAPEHAAGQDVDARADVYSAGVVLAEMVSPEGVKSYESRQSVWEGIRSEPAKVPDSPWAAVIQRAVAKDRERRQSSVHTLIRELEEVTLRVEGAEDLHPYPGLASFTEADAEFFFGREAEVERMWRKLEGPPHLLGLIGPSGAGKTSFLNAGVVPNTPSGCGVLRSTPGDDAFAGLRRALAAELAGDAEAVQELVQADDIEAIVAAVSRWRRRFSRAVLVLDQFEELFTLHSADRQARFASLVARLIVEADVFVLSSMRDDFLIFCNRHEPLRPVLSDLMALDPPTGAALRRALTQPALQCGYRFEDEQLVDEMLAEVEGERGALPLLAFAAARLWEKRDREGGLLTRQAYHDIGGVGGALARHAEATVDRIGHERLPIVRELFRNLVTAEGTRAVREWNELLSVFDEGKRVGIKPSPTKDADKRIVGAGFTPARAAAEDVLRELVDARLLTSYEVREADEAPTRRVEIIHESLLANWPRLVRWQTQDADAAQLRDQLRQAARTWDEHGRTDDMLWTGSAYREFAFWRERYPGGLSELEEAFAQAMTSLATRRRRRRRIAVAASFAILLTVLAVVGTFWRRSVLETRKAEAAKLLALAQAQLDTDPTEALAYTMASLEVSDSPSARSFVMRVLWQAPAAVVLEAHTSFIRFSPEGGWIAASGYGEMAEVWSGDGDGPIMLRGLGGSTMGNVGSWSSERLLVIGPSVGEHVRIWSVPEGQLVGTIEFGDRNYWQVIDDHVMTETYADWSVHEDHTVLRLRSWPLPQDEPEELGWVDQKALGASSSLFGSSGGAWIYVKGRKILARPLPVADGGPERVVGAHEADDVRLVSRASNGDRLVSIDGEGELRVWSLSMPGAGPVRVIPRPETATAPFLLIPDPTDRWVYRSEAYQIGKGLLWDLSAVPGARPLELRRSGSWKFSNFDFHPSGDWLAATTDLGTEVSLWPLRRTYPSVVDGATTLRKGLAFSPDGRWLAATWPPERARIFPLPHTDKNQLPHLAGHTLFSHLVFDAPGTHLTGGNFGPDLSVVPLDGGDPRRLEGFLSETLVEAAAFSPSGRLVAAAPGINFNDSERTLRVWNLDTGEVRAFELPRTDTTEWAGYAGYLDNVKNLWFTDEETLYTMGATAFLRWDLRDGSSEKVVDVKAVEKRTAAASADLRKVLIIESADLQRSGICDTPKFYDLAAGTVEELPSFGDCVVQIALDPEGTVAVTGDQDGIIRVGRLTAGEPHLLVGHEGGVECVAISPNLRYVASIGSDGTLRLWPIPDLDKPPLHTLPHDELIAKLHSLTNLRAVRDEESPTGWSIEVGPFPGWETVPTW